MVEPEKKDYPPNLEDTVRNLREENAKLLQLLRSQGLLFDPPPPSPATAVDGKTNEPSNIIFDNSDITLTTNSINTTNQITHQHVNNHGPINQQNYSGQVVHGNQSNITPNFNTVIQTTTQPFVQNNSNTLVQNNTNLIQPINLVNFNNVSLDSIQSFFASQNNLVYLSQPSSSSSTTTTTTTTTSNMKFNNDTEQHQISIRPKPSIIPQQQQQPDLTPVLPKVKNEYYENMSRQLSSSNSETTNLLDNDLNHKQPRPIRPKPSSRNNPLQVYAPVIMSDTKPSNANVLTPPSLINNAATSSTVSLLSPSRSFDEHHMDTSPQFIQSKSMDASVAPTNNLLTSTKKPNKNSARNRKKTGPSPVVVPANNSTLIPIAPNPGRPLAPAPVNVQRIVATNKRSITNKKSNSKTFMEYHSESIIQQNSSPTNSFAESISGLMQNFDQELMAANFLTQPPTTNILSNDTSNNVNIIRTLDNIDVRHIVNTTIQRNDSYQSMPTIDEFNDRLEGDVNQTIQDYNVDNEQITSFMNEEDMRFAEMNFDENTFLKQFDLDDAGIKLNVHSEQNIFTSLLTNTHHLNTSVEQSNPSSLPPPPTLPPPSIYPGSSLINNNIFTTVVPLGLQQQSSNNHTYNYNASRCLPEEGVQLTARHIEPSQVATYESVKYQDILDDLVTVTDQDVLSHVQAAAANETTVISTDFSFALLEATNEIIKTTEIQGAEETASAFVDLQYFYPIEQEQELLQKQLEECEQKDEPETSTILEEKFPTELLSSTESPKSNENPAITDLASIIQINQTNSPSPITETAPTIDYDALLPPSPPSLPQSAPPPPPPPPPLPPPVSASAPVEFPMVFDNSSRKACIIFEPILSPINSLSPIKPASPINHSCSIDHPSPINPPSLDKPSKDEMILDSGCLMNSFIDKPNTLNNDEIEELLNESSDNPYEIIENAGHTAPSNDLTIENLDQLVEQIEQPTGKVLEKNFLRYQQIYHDSLKKKPKEQYAPIPSVKLKLNSIYIKHKKKRKSSPSPVPISEDIRPPLKIKITTKLPPRPPPSPPPPVILPIVSPEKPLLPKIKIRKPTKKLKRKKSSTPSIDDQLEREAKLSLKTEYAGLTRFEQSLAQLYHQQSSPDTQIPPTPGENEDLTTVPNKQDTPPTHEMKLNSTSPLNQNKKLTHLLNYDDEPLNNNTFITPPPDIDVNIQQQKISNDFYQNSKKPKKSQQNSFNNREYYPSATRNTQVLPRSQPSPIHLDPYSQSYHHYDPRTTPFFNFPFPNPFMNAHPTTTSSHFHHNPMKYHYPTHNYPAHQQQYSYHPHLQPQQQYNNANYMSSHDHHPFDR
ncbi:unnamed protein product [Rotaria magnacalcarata]|uniref:Uncharacterized protein n=1 Tax=Rotaria magnacalcarata TaxID=392030 RepID=A0A816VM21_9BILA|nr:unnamed protein product [Rotaria magnacalcarata]